MHQLGGKSSVFKMAADMFSSYGSLFPSIHQCIW